MCIFKAQVSTKLIDLCITWYKPGRNKMEHIIWSQCIEGKKAKKQLYLMRYFTTVQNKPSNILPTTIISNGHFNNLWNIAFLVKLFSISYIINISKH